ncbi:MAG: FAD-binding oxidoreductase, partial [Angelakisella sp.]
MKSIWSETAEIPGREALSGNLSAEVAVIGAGMAGILTAYLLQKQGKQVVVLEAERIGSGQTKNTTAKITSQHSLIYDRLIREFGMDKAQQYASANEAAIAMYRSIIALEGIDCHFESRPAFLYSTEESAPLMREAEAAASLGIAATFTTDTTLPFPISGAVRFEGQAQFHPLDFLCGISKELT